MTWNQLRVVITCQQRTMTKELISKRYKELTDEMANLGVIEGPSGWQTVGLQEWNRWGTSALNIIEASFGVDSVHFEQLKKAIADWDTQGFDYSIAAAKGVFLAARAPPISLGHACEQHASGAHGGCCRRSL